MNRIQRRRCLGIILLVLTILCWSSLISIKFYHPNSPASPNSSASRDKGWEVIWYDSLYLTHIWGDNSSLFTGAKFDSSQDGWQIKLQKWDLNGTSVNDFLWNRDNEHERLTGIWGNSESVCISGYLYDFNYTTHEEIYSYGYIKKFDKKLDIEWSVSLTNSVLSDIWCNNEHIYTVGLTRLENSTRAMLISKWDMNGQLVWNKTEDLNYGSFRIMGNNGSVYIDCMQTFSSDFIHTLSKWNFNGTKEWNKTSISNHWASIYPVGDIWVGENHIFRMQEFHGSDDEFSPLKLDLVLQKWDTDGNMIWQRGGLASHAYSEGSTIPYTRIWGNGTDIYLCTDNYRANIKTSDLYLIHFDKNGKILEEKTWRYSRNMQVLGNVLWGNTDSVYSGGWIRVKTDYSDHLAGLDIPKFLMKWSDEPNIPLIVGVSVGGSILGIIVITVSIVSIKRRRR